MGRGPDPLSPSGPAHGSSLKLYFPSQTYVFFILDGNLLLFKTTLHGYKKSARDQAHDIWRLELGKTKHTTFFSETQIFVLTNNLRCFDETDVRTSQKTTYVEFKIYRTNFIDEIGPGKHIYKFFL